MVDQSRVQQDQKELQGDSFSLQPSLALGQKADTLGLDYREDIDVKDIDKEILSLVPEDTARRFRMVAVGKDDDGVVEIVMEDPEDTNALNTLRFLAKEKALRFLVTMGSPSVVNRVLSCYDSAEKAVKKVEETLSADEQENRKKTEQERLSEMELVIRDAPVAKLVEVIIRHAIDGKASDVHIEPSEKEYRIRYRVDGVLFSSLILPKNVGKTVVARIKILSNLKIDEKRKPQDGRFYSELGNKRVDFRVSTFPVVEGEKVVLRVLDKDSGIKDLKDLGLIGKNLEIFTQRIHDPYGIILVTGPTGSGKSTTLYGFLRILNVNETNIVTLEDPVEYLIQGINQSQINPDIGYTFASGLRSILRQDPNVIMVGEIRDSETAELSIHAALTGHLVFSTLHTNDAMGAIPRLLDMGVESFLLSASLRVVAAQRLARRVCKRCKDIVHLSSFQKERIRDILKDVEDREITKYGVTSEILETAPVVKGKGCSDCGGSGFKGRVAIYEVLEVNEEIQEILNDEKEHAEEKLKQALKNQKMITMKQDGVLKALLGLTTLEEVERITEGSKSVGGDVEDDAG